jgi:hypothetical protein
LLLIDSEFRLIVVFYDAVFLIECFLSVVPVRLFLSRGGLSPGYLRFLRVIAAIIPAAFYSFSVRVYRFAAFFICSSIFLRINPSSHTVSPVYSNG